MSKKRTAPSHGGSRRSLANDLREDLKLDDHSKRPAIKRRVLVVDADYKPLTTVSLKKAVNLIFKESATIIKPPATSDGHDWMEYHWCDWEDLTLAEGEIGIVGAKRDYKIPEVIRVVNYRCGLVRRSRLSRRAIYKRDMFTCQYCGQTAPQIDVDDLTIDHVKPRSRGGKTSWDNLVVACGPCNRRKGDRTPEQADMPLLNKPVIPDYDIFQGRLVRVDSWTHFFGPDYWQRNKTA